MADDIDELLDEVESKFIHHESRMPDSQVSETSGRRGNSDLPEELDAAIHSICSIPEPVETSSIVSDVSLLNRDPNRKCTVVYVGDSSAASGLSGGVNQSACDNLRCTSCDFRVSIFKDFAWDPATNYLFLRNNMPDFDKLRSKLKIKKGWSAYGCQCHCMSVNVLTELKKASHVKWVCAGHEL